MIGVAIYIVGDSDKQLTLWMIGIGLFLFSFSAGFGGIYFKEIIAKVFSRQERGRSMADKQLFSSLAAIISGGVTGVILENFQAPTSYAYLFMISAILMSIGLFAFATNHPKRASPKGSPPSGYLSKMPTLPSKEIRG